MYLCMKYIKRLHHYVSAGEKSCFLLEREVGEDQGDVDLIVQYYQLWSLYGGERSEIMFPGCACMVGPVSLHRQRMWDLGKKKKGWPAGSRHASSATYCGTATFSAKELGLRVPVN